MTLDEVKQFIMENKKGLVVGAIVALAIRALLS